MGSRGGNLIWSWIIMELGEKMVLGTLVLSKSSLRFGLTVPAT